MQTVESTLTKVLISAANSRLKHVSQNVLNSLKIR